SVTCLTGSVNVAVNQQINGGAWFRLAAGLPFGQGTNGYVGLANDTGYSGSVVIADAVRFLRVSALAPPVINSQPQSLAAVVGGNASFAVSASSTFPLRYDWRKNGVSLPGQTAATLTLTNIQAVQFANYTVLVSNDDGSVLSQPAAL